METEHVSHLHSSFFEKASYVVLIVTIVLGLLAFTPAAFLSIATLKTFVIGIGVLISAILFLFSKIGKKSVKFSSHPLVWVASATALGVILSSALSPSVASSFFGKDFAVDTAAFLLVLFASGALSFSLTKGHENRTFFIFSAILGSFSLLALFHILRFFTGPNFPSLGTFSTVVTTTVGSWHDFGIFAGLSLIISLVTLQLLPIANKIARTFFIAAFILAAASLVVVDLQSVWIIVGIATLAFTVYKFILNKRENHVAGASKKGILSLVPVFSLVVTIVALVLAWSPGSIGTFINSDIITNTGATYTEIDLPWGITMDIAEPTLKASPLFGAGPDRFVNEYLKYKPEIINATAFWQADFSNGTGFILTSLVTEGALGFILWIALIICFLWFGAAFILGKNDVMHSPSRRYGAVVSYFGAAFLWISLIDFMPQHAVMLLLFILTGVFVAHLVSVKGIQKTFNFSHGPLKVPAMILVWILIAACLISIIFYVKSTIAEAYFQSAVESLNSGGTLSASSQKIQSALYFNKSDVFYQAIAQMDVYAVNQIISNSTSTPTETTITLIGSLINDGINSAHLAEKFDPTNPYNYLTEAQVSVVAAGIDVKGAYADATSSYQRALALDPFDPSIYLAMAKLDYFEKNSPAVQNDLTAALELKPDYADALFEVGVISYGDKDYATAVQAFTQVQEIESDYPNIQDDLNLAKAAETATPIGTVAATSSKTVVK